MTQEEKKLYKEISRCRVRATFWKKKTEMHKKELNKIHEKEHKESIDKAISIIKLIKDRYSLSEDYNVSQSQKEKDLEPIYKAAKLIDNNTKLTLYDFEPLFNRDRSTITYILKSVDNTIDTDKKYKIEYMSILEEHDLKYKKYTIRK